MKSTKKYKATWNQKKQIESNNGNRTCDYFFHNKDDFQDHFE